MNTVFEDIENGYTIREDETTGQMFVGDIYPRIQTPPSRDGLLVFAFIVGCAEIVLAIKVIGMLWKGWQ